MAKGFLNPCPRCGGSILPVEYTDQRIWRCSSFTRTFGTQPVQTFTDEDVKQDQFASRHIDASRRYFGSR